MLVKFTFVKFAFLIIIILRFNGPFTIFENVNKRGNWLFYQITNIAIPKSFKRTDSANTLQYTIQFYWLAIGNIHVMYQSHMSTKGVQWQKRIKELLRNECT